MAQALKITAELRSERGKNAARRLRHAGHVPAVVYGGGAEAVAVSVNPRELAPILHTEAGHTSVLTMEIEGRSAERVMLKDWLREPVRGGVLHVDFVRVTKDTRVKVRVPIHATGEPKGVKLQGGIFEFALREVEVECLPDDIPENITVDVSELMIGQNIRVSHLPAPANVKVLSDSNRVVAHVVALKAEEEVVAVEGAEAATAEPEVIRKGKAEEEGAEESAPESKESKGGKEK
ncbi:MAG TPA: 50S ribosomal protein L25/general stress protein Ctc [Terriglobia bacterium]|nr:50S ribosomal protein L25/general stress protein Ctc [Terriglobia bacterium]